MRIPLPIVVLSYFVMCVFGTLASGIIYIPEPTPPPLWFLLRVDAITCYLWAGLLSCASTFHEFPGFRMLLLFITCWPIRYVYRTYRWAINKPLEGEPFQSEFQDPYRNETRG